MSDMTPGQAAREAFGVLGADWYPGTSWDALHEDLRAQWEAAANAAVDAKVAAVVTAAEGGTVIVALRNPVDAAGIQDMLDRWAEYGPEGANLVIVEDVAAITAQQPQADEFRELTETPPASHPVSHTPAVARPELGSVIVLALQENTPEESARELADTLAALNQGVAVVTVRGVDALRTWEPQPGPDLAALRSVLTEVLMSFEDSHSNGWYARVSGTVLGRWRKRAGIEEA